MPFVSKERLEQNISIARDGREALRKYRSLEKKLAKQAEHYDNRIEDILDEKDRITSRLEREQDKREALITERVQEVEEKLLKDIRILEEGQDALTDEIDALNKRLKKAGDLREKELNLAEEEREIRVKRLALDKVTKDLESREKELEKKIADKSDASYKRGYTDGVSDTLREGQKLSETANDRVFKLAETSLNRDNVVITTTQTPTKSK